MKKNRVIVVVLTLLVATLIIIIWKLAWRDTYTMWDVRDARVALRRIANNRLEASEGTVADSLRCFSEIVSCYTNWSWQRPDLHLGACVEEQRRSAVQEVLRSLRTRTGRDFGENPADWIRGLQTNAALPSDELRRGDP